MHKTILIILCVLHSFFLVGMSSSPRGQQHAIVTTTASFLNKLTDQLRITINNDQAETLISFGAKERVLLSSDVPDFIHTIVFNDKRYGKNNGVIADWNWKIAQAAGCGPESGYRYSQNPTFTIDDIMLDILDFANGIEAKGIEAAQEDGTVQISVNDEVRFTTQRGYAGKFKIYRPTDKKIIRFFNRSSDELTIKINKKSKTTIAVSSETDHYPLEIKSDFKIKKLGINGHFFDEYDLITVRLNAIIEKIFPGHCCDIDFITDEFLKELVQETRVNFLNCTDRSLVLIINDLPACALAPKTLPADQRPDSETQQGSPRLATMRKRALSNASSSQVMTTLKKDLQGLYISTLIIDGKRYTSGNKTIEGLNAHITNASCLEEEHPAVELCDRLLRGLESNQESLDLQEISSSDQPVVTSSGYSRIPLVSRGVKRPSAPPLVKPLDLLRIQHSHSRMPSSSSEDPIERSPRHDDIGDASSSSSD